MILPLVSETELPEAGNGVLCRHTSQRIGGQRSSRSLEQATSAGGTGAHSGAIQGERKL